MRNPITKSKFLQTNKCQSAIKDEHGINCYAVVDGHNEKSALSAVLWMPQRDTDIRIIIGRVREEHTYFETKSWHSLFGIWGFTSELL
jgi:hypothetical protein